MYRSQAPQIAEQATHNKINYDIEKCKFVFTIFLQSKPYHFQCTNLLRNVE